MKDKREDQHRRQGLKDGPYTSEEGLPVAYLDVAPYQKAERFPVVVNLIQVEWLPFLAGSIFSSKFDCTSPRRSRASACSQYSFGPTRSSRCPSLAEKRKLHGAQELAHSSKVLPQLIDFITPQLALRLHRCSRKLISRCAMKFFASIRPLPLVCALFLGIGSPSYAGASMPSAAGLLAASTDSVIMKAVLRAVPQSLSPELRIARAVLPMRELRPLLTRSVPRGLKSEGRQSVQGAVLRRTAQSAAFQSGAYGKFSGIEESSYLIVLGTCLLGSAAALFRKMNT
jgi:hypothetical protein